MLLTVAKSAWQELVRSLTLAFPLSPRYKKMFFVELIGLQDHTLVHSVLLWSIISMLMYLEGPERHIHMEVELWAQPVFWLHWCHRQGSSALLVCLFLLWGLPQSISNIFRYPSLAEKPGEQPLFRGLEFVPGDSAMDLSTIINSARREQFWPCMLVNALYLSGSCSHFVRSVTRQYPVVRKYD